MSNTQGIEKMRNNASDDYKISANMSQSGAQDYDKKMEYCRTQLHKSEYLDYYANSALKNLDGASLTKDSQKFEDFARAIKKEYLLNVTKSKIFVTAAIPINNLKIVKEQIQDFI